MDNVQFWIEFLRIYEESPALWRVNSPEYANQSLKSKCFKTLARKLQEIYPEANREMAVRKIKHMRACYRKELRKVRESRLLGKTYQPTLWYFNYLSFLDDQDDNLLADSPVSEMEHTEEEQESQDAEKEEVPRTPGRHFTNRKRLGNFDVASGDEDGDVKGEECASCSSKRIKVSNRMSKMSKLTEKEEAIIEAEMMASSWAVQYKKMQDKQKLIARKLISDILFYGCLGNLNMNNALEMQEKLSKQPNDQTLLLNAQTQTVVIPHTLVTNREFYGAVRDRIITARPYNSSSPPSTSTTNSSGTMTNF